MADDRDLDNAFDQTYYNASLQESLIQESLDRLTDGDLSHPLHQVIKGTIISEGIQVSQDHFERLNDFKQIVENLYLVPESESNFPFMGAEAAKVALLERRASNAYSLISKPIYYQKAAFGHPILIKDPYSPEHPIYQARVKMNLYNINQKGRAPKQVLIFNNNFPKTGAIDSRDTFSFIPSTEFMLLGYLSSLGILRSDLQIYNFIEATGVKAAGMPDNAKLKQIVTASDKLQTVYTLTDPTNDIIYRYNAEQTNLSNISFSNDIKHAVGEMIQKIYEVEK